MVIRFLLAIVVLLSGCGSHHSRFIVDPFWVNAHPEALLVEASWTPADAKRDYDVGHIPNAVHINTDDFETPRPDWLLRPLPELQRVIGDLGIGPSTTVVVYSSKSIAAARVWWILHYAGVKDVRILNGGLEGWIRAGYLKDMEPHNRPPVRFEAKPRASILASTADVANRGDVPLLVDVRSLDEYAGRTSGYSYLAAKGRIPGAIHAEDADDSAAVYQKRDGTLRSVDEIRKLWMERGLLSGQQRPLIFYCGSGWRSSLAFLYAAEMGLMDIRNYSDGWTGWNAPDKRE